MNKYILGAVSYTHLDVYKRQVLGSTFIIVGVLISLLFQKRTRKEEEVLV